MKPQFPRSVTVLFLVWLSVCPLIKCEESGIHGLPTNVLVQITLYTLAVLTVFATFLCTMKYCLSKPSENQSVQTEYMNVILSTEDLRSESRSISGQESGPTVTGIILKQSPHHFHDQINEHIQMSIPEETVEQLRDDEVVQQSSKEIVKHSSTVEDPSGDYEQIWFRSKPAEKSLIDIN